MLDLIFAVTPGARWEPFHVYLHMMEPNWEMTFRDEASSARRP